jgi:hypothetical protein
LSTRLDYSDFYGRDLDYSDFYGRDLDYSDFYGRGLDYSDFHGREAASDFRVRHHFAHRLVVLQEELRPGRDEKPISARV